MKRYPCKGGSCGCKSAEQCWTNCCCNSPAQRLAWAKKNQLTPPEYAVLEDNPQKESVPIVPLQKKVLAMNQGIACCNKPIEDVTTKSCCEKRRSPATKESCTSCRSNIAAKKLGAQKTGAMPNSAHGKTKRSVVVSMLALKCQGANSVFMQLPWMLPSVRPETICVAYLDTYHWPFAKPFLSVDREPDTPPPKRHFS